MSVTAEDVRLVNQALTRCGVERLTSFDDEVPAAVVATENYEGIAREMLSIYRWRWTSTLRDLVRIDGEEIAGEVWGSAWQLPEDYLEGTLQTVTEGGWPIAYEVDHDKVLTDETAPTAVLTAQFCKRAPEEEWPAYFKALVVKKLEALFLRSIGERHAEAAAAEEYLETVILPRARTLDAQTQTPRQVFGSTLVAIRRGDDWMAAASRKRLLIP